MWLPSYSSAGHLRKNPTALASASGTRRAESTIIELKFAYPRSLDVKRWASLIGKFVVTMNACVRKTAAKFGDKPDERSLLSLGASVFRRFAIGRAATNVANAD